MYVADREGFDASRLQFLQVEFETAKTFISIAESAGEDREKADRNRANGRRAYDTILKFLPRLALTAAEQMEWEKRVEAMKAALVALGEVFA